jgi:hypothetical protein
MPCWLDLFYSIILHESSSKLSDALTVDIEYRNAKGEDEQATGKDAKKSHVADALEEADSAEGDGETNNIPE